MKLGTVLFLIITSLSNLSSQSDCYQNLLKQGQQLYSSGDYEGAITKYLAALNCDKINQNDLARLIKKAQAAREKDLISARDSAKVNLSRAQRVNYHLNFRNEGAAWAYKNGRFAVINRDGDTLTPFKYESPKPFMKGVAFALVNNQYVFVNKRGKEISERYNFMIPTEHNLYFAGYPSKNIIVNNSGEEIFIISSDTHNDSNSEHFYVTTGDHLKGLMNRRFQEVFPPKYVSIGKFSENLAKVNIGGDLSDGYWIKGGTWAYIDTLGNVKIEPNDYEEVGNFSEGMTMVKRNGLRGFINKDGIEKITPEYQDVSDFKDNKSIVSIHNDSLNTKLWAIINKKGKRLTERYYDYIDSTPDGFFRVSSGNKQGFLNGNCKLVIPVQHDQLGPFSEGIAFAQDSNRLYLVDSSNNLTPIFKYDEFTEFHEGRAGIRKGDFWGFVDKKGIELSKPQYTYVKDFSNGVARVNNGGYWSVHDYFRGGKWGLVDSSGFEIAKTEYDWIDDFRDGIALASKDGKKTYIQNNGKEPVLLPIWPDPHYENEYEITPIDRIYYIIDRLGHFHPSPYSFTFGPSEGLYLVSYDFKHGFLDSLFNLTIPVIYNEADDFSEGLSAVRLNGKSGYIDHLGNRKIPFVFDKCYSFSNGRALVNFGGSGPSSYDFSGGKWGLIDKSGKLVVDTVYDLAYPTRNASYCVSCNGSWGLINSFGEPKIKPAWEAIRTNENGYFDVMNNDCWGISDTFDNLLLPPVFDEVEDYSSGMFKVKKGDLWGLVSEKGKTLFPVEFDDISILDNTLIAYKKNDAWTLFDLLTKQSVVSGYAGIYPCDSTAVIIKDKNAKMGLIDRQGQTLIPVKYDRLDLFSRDLLSADSGGVITLINHYGIKAVNNSFDKIESVNTNLEKVTRAGKFGFIDTLGNEVLPCEFTDISPAGYRIFLLEQNGRYGLFAPDLDINLPCDYDQIGFPEEENRWIRVKRSGKWGWVDYSNNVKIECQYDAATPFLNGKARVVKEPYTEEFTINYKGEMQF